MIATEEPRRSARQGRGKRATTPSSHSTPRSSKTSSSSSSSSSPTPGGYSTNYDCKYQPNLIFYNYRKSKNIPRVIEEIVLIEVSSETGHIVSCISIPFHHQRGQGSPSSQNYDLRCQQQRQQPHHASLHDSDNIKNSVNEDQDGNQSDKDEGEGKKDKGINSGKTSQTSQTVEELNVSEVQTGKGEEEERATVQYSKTETAEAKEDNQGGEKEKMESEIRKEQDTSAEKQLKEACTLKTVRGENRWIQSEYSPGSVTSHMYSCLQDKIWIYCGESTEENERYEDLREPKQKT